VLAAVLIAPRSGRNAVIAVASLVFYASGAGGTTLLLLVCIVVNYLAGLRLEPRPDRDARNRKLLLAATVAVNLTILFIWKYAGFATAQIAVLASWFGIDDYPVLELVLPIGISFYTFHHIS
ncbi:hypothetical protein LH612_37470, partial [Klebsiella pneumoniae]|nr:hypothetical protein [Klebsiella pneumoniae]